uniref:Uncharacterized protein n=1 Tax=Babesia bovis TaxID=5865 RepID=S6BL14_BABBO|nr:hypothetical protein [Babesia bovis]
MKNELATAALSLPDKLYAKKYIAKTLTTLNAGGSSTQMVLRSGSKPIYLRKTYIPYVRNIRP